MALRWIAGLILLQISLLGLLVDPMVGDAYTAGDLHRLLFGPALAVGKLMPALTLYNQHGRQRVIFTRQPQPTTLILSGCSTCSLARIRDWSETARLRGDRVVVVFNSTPKQFASLCRSWRGPGELYRASSPSLYRSLGADMLPLQVYITREGTIFHVGT